MDTFGKRLIELRKSKGLTQTDLADYFGKAGKATISSWETDKSNPSFDELIMLADFFKTTTDYLLRGIEGGMVQEEKAEYITIPKDELIELQRMVINSRIKPLQNQE